MKKTKADAIIDKLLGIESWAYRARHLDQVSQKEQCEAAIKNIMKITGELWLLWKTPEEKGIQWEWWE